MKRVRETPPVRTCRAWRAIFLLAALAVASQAPLASAQMGEGTQGRQWVAGPQQSNASPAQYQVIELTNQYMDVRDGTRLAYNLYLPMAPWPFPCLLIMEGYGKDGIIASKANAQDFASRGYAVVQADNRGEGASQGYWDPFSEQQQEDGYDLVEWEAQQPWCNGRVGTFGTSYMAIVQFLMAKHLPPHLVAMIPVQGWGDAYQQYYHGGWRAVADGTLWALGIEQPLQLTPPSDGDTQTWQDHLVDQPTATRLINEWHDHPNSDGFWAERSTLAADHAAMARAGIAILFQTGWNDLFPYTETKAYREFAAAGGRRKLVIGPWNHGGESNPDVEPYTFQTYRVLWFDRWLKGVNNGVDKEPKALLYIPGANQWRFEKEWPIPDTKYAKFYLRADRSGSAPSVNDGSLSAHAPAAETPDVYVYDPTEVAGGPSQLFAGGEQSPADQRIDETRSLTWTTPPLSSPTEVTGPITFTFWAASTAADTNFCARLVDVAPDGSATQITRGWLNTPHYPDPAHPQPLAPGETYQFSMEIWPTSHVFEAGHRIRLDLSGADVPLMEVNPNPAIDTIYHDAAHPSYVVLPIIGTSPLLAGGYDAVAGDPVPPDLWDVADQLDAPTGGGLPY